MEREPNFEPQGEKNAELLAFRKSVSQQVKALSRLCFPRAVGEIAFTWFVIVGCTLLGVQMEHSLWILPFLLLIIAARQHALFILMHESAHFRLAPSRRINDRLGNWLMAYPLGIEMRAYRKNHQKHHQYTNQSQDPDWQRKKDHPDWQFPMGPLPLAWLGVRYLVGYGVVEMLQTCWMLSGFHPRLRTENSSSLALRASFYLILLGAIHYGGGWSVFAVYWCLPWCTFLPLLMRLRSVAEHFAIKRNHPLNQSRNIECQWIEKLLFGPHAIGLHADHHLFPSIPCYHLERFHNELKKNEYYRLHSHLNKGYLLGGKESLISELIRTNGFK